ncbi:hypothetical protein ACWGJB_33045 [Streptomyces sp. NPDC054813]
MADGGLPRPVNDSPGSERRDGTLCGVPHPRCIICKWNGPEDDDYLFSVRWPERPGRGAARCGPAVGRWRLERSSTRTTSGVNEQLASRREDELGEIVDLCVGIEALLGGTAAGDTTYKLGIRGAAVLRRAKFQDSERVAQLIKKVYAYRSNVVHGQVKYEKKRVVSLDGKQFLVSGIAEILLREILAVMLHEPDLISKIDNDRVIFELLDNRGRVAGED